MVMLPSVFSTRIARPLGMLALSLVLFSAGRAEADSPVSTASGWDLSDLMDHLPDFKNLGLPGIRPGGPVTIYARPHLGDFVHRDYLRLPVGVRLRLDEHNEFTTVLESYFTHGLSGPAGYGLSRLQIGMKHEQEFKAWPGTAWSWGVDFATPLSRPPVELSDGHRHTLPFVSISRALVPRWHLVGYTGFGADLLARTDLPVNFGRNELHSNSLTLGVGVTRDWQRYQAALTATVATSTLVSNESRQVFTLRPDVLIPLTRFTGKHTRLLFSVGGRAITGPDGTEYGVSSSLRVEFGVVPADATR